MAKKSKKITAETKKPTLKPKSTFSKLQLKRIKEIDALKKKKPKLSKLQLKRRKEDALKKAQKPKATPVGQKNLQELLALGDLSSKISAASKSVTDKRREKISEYSAAQLKAAMRAQFKERNPKRKISFPQGMSKERLIEIFLRDKVGDKFLPKTKKKDVVPKKKYTLEGWGIAGDEEGDDWWLGEAGFKFKESYATGLETWTANLTNEEYVSFRDQYEESLSQSTKLFRETARKRYMTWG